MREVAYSESLVLARCWIVRVALIPMRLVEGLAHFILMALILCCVRFLVIR